MRCAISYRSILVVASKKVNRYGQGRIVSAIPRLRQPMPTIVARAVPTVHGEAVGHHARKCACATNSGDAKASDARASYQPRRSPEGSCGITGPPPVAVWPPRCCWTPQGHRASRENAGLPLSLMVGVRDRKKTLRGHAGGASLASRVGSRLDCPSSLRNSV
jgi:hypothetical protein